MTLGSMLAPKIQKIPITHLLLALLGGSLLPLAFAPFSVVPLTIASPCLLFWVWKDKTPAQAFRLGWLFGVGFFGIGSTWIFISLHRYGNMGTSTAVALTTFLIASLALFPGCQGFVQQRCFPNTNRLIRLIGWPSVWVLFEWLREWVFTGYPWMYLGTAHTSSILSGYAPIIGVFGLSWLCACAAAGIIESISTRHWIPVLILMLFAIAGIPLRSIAWTHASAEPILASAIQANIPQEMKWQPGSLPVILHRYAELMKTVPKSNIIVWPESAIPLPLPKSKPIINILSQQAHKNHAAWFTGILKQSPDHEHYYNTVVAVGENRGAHAKRILAPFGEYVPFASWFEDLFDFFDLPFSLIIPGPNHQATVFYQNIPVAIFICYEIAYPSELFRNEPNAQLLITVSDNSWFGNSLEPHQLLQMAQMRSLESGRQQILSTNTGITAFINDKGQILTQAKPFTQAVLTSTLVPKVGQTPYLSMSYWPLILGCLWVILLLHQHNIYNLNHNQSTSPTTKADK